MVNRYYALNMDLTTWAAPDYDDAVWDKLDSDEVLYNALPPIRLVMPKGTIVRVSEVSESYGRYHKVETMVTFFIDNNKRVLESFNGPFNQFFSEVDQSAAAVLFGAGRG